MALSASSTKHSATDQLAISHEQIRQICLQEAVRVEAQEQANFQQAYNQALAETVEVLVEEQPRLKMRPQIEPCERVCLGIDGTLIKARAQNRLMEAKVSAERSIGRLRSSASSNGIQSTSVVKQTTCRYTAISAAV